MTKAKTQPSAGSVTAFINAVEETRRADCKTIAKMMRRISGSPPKMWGSAMVGFGSYHYRYASGREGDWFITGFSPRKQYLTVYIMSGFSAHSSLLKQLGKFKTGKSCLYLKSLEQVDAIVLEELIAESVATMKAKYGCA
jgi:hypothetical protein